MKLIGVICHSQLNKHVPRATESYPSYGSAIEGKNIFQAINTSVIQGVSVSISFKSTIPLDFHELGSSEQSMVRNVFIFTFLNKFRSEERRVGKECRFRWSEEHE